MSVFTWTRYPCTALHHLQTWTLHPEKYSLTAITEATQFSVISTCDPAIHPYLLSWSFYLAFGRPTHQYFLGEQNFFEEQEASHPPMRCRANLEHISQSTPDASLVWIHFGCWSLQIHSNYPTPARQRSGHVTARLLKTSKKSENSALTNRKS